MAPRCLYGPGGSACAFSLGSFRRVLRTVAPVEFQRERGTEVIEDEFGTAIGLGDRPFFRWKGLVSTLPSLLLSTEYVGSWIRVLRVSVRRR